MGYIRERRDNEYREYAGIEVIIEFNGKEVRNNKVLVLGKKEIEYKKERRD